MYTVEFTFDDGRNIILHNIDRLDRTNILEMFRNREIYVHTDSLENITAIDMSKLRHVGFYKV